MKKCFLHVLLTVSAACGAGCGDGSRRVLDGNWCFWLGEDCAENGGVLAGVGSVAELRTVEEMMVQQGAEVEIWVAAGKTGGQWAWNDGTVGNPLTLQIKDQKPDLNEPCAALVIDFHVAAEIKASPCSTEGRLSLCKSNYYTPGLNAHEFSPTTTATTFTYTPPPTVTLPGPTTSTSGDGYNVKYLSHPVRNCTPEGKGSLHVVTSRGLNVSFHNAYESRHGPARVEVSWGGTVLQWSGVDYGMPYSFYILKNTTRGTLEVHVNGNLAASTVLVGEGITEGLGATEVLTPRGVTGFEAHTDPTPALATYLKNTAQTIFTLQSLQACSPTPLTTSVSPSNPTLDMLSCQAACLSTPGCLSVVWSPLTQCVLDVRVVDALHYNTSDETCSSTLECQCWSRPEPAFSSSPAMVDFSGVVCPPWSGEVPMHPPQEDVVRCRFNGTGVVHGCGVWDGVEWDLAGCAPEDAWLALPVGGDATPNVAVQGADGDVSVDFYSCGMVGPLFPMSLTCTPIPNATQPVHYASQYVAIRVASTILPRNLTVSVSPSTEEELTPEESLPSLVDTEQVAKVLGYVVVVVVFGVMSVGHVAYLKESGLRTPDVKEEECPKIPAQPTFAAPGPSVARPQLPNTIGSGSPPRMVPKSLAYPTNPSTDERIAVYPSSRVKSADIVEGTPATRWRGPGVAQASQAVGEPCSEEAAAIEPCLEADDDVREGDEKREGQDEDDKEEEEEDEEDKNNAEKSSAGTPLSQVHTPPTPPLSR